MAAQEKAPKYEAPVLTLKAIAEKMATMDKEVRINNVPSLNIQLIILIDLIFR